jgi:hypothetical protein
MAGLKLTGTVISDDPVALIHSPQREFVVKAGESVLGARVQEVARDRVVLIDIDGQEIVLKPFKEEKNEKKK